MSRSTRHSGGRHDDGNVGNTPVICAGYAALAL